MPITLDGTNGITTPTYGGADTSEYLVPVTQFKNRLINGNMSIDQRNAGAAVTVDGNYPVDRFTVTNVTDGAFSSSRSSTSTAGFVNSLYFTTTTADASLSATQRCHIKQVIEGFNIADLAWGTANAQTVTLSFWVRSSLTGTFGGALQNGAGNRSYPFTYTISSANTFEYKTITVSGDTSGTWATDNTAGMSVFIGLGVGSTYSGTAGAWAGSDFRSATGAVSVIGTLNATFYITGVQLEVGSTATSFDYRPYGTELALCQRYYWQINGAAGFCAIGSGYASGAGAGRLFIKFPNSMRASPTMSYGGSIPFGGPSAAPAITSFAGVYSGTEAIMIDIGASGGGLTSGQGAIAYTSPSSSANYVQASAEL